MALINKAWREGEFVPPGDIRSRDSPRASAGEMPLKLRP